MTDKTGYIETVGGYKGFDIVKQFNVPNAGVVVQTVAEAVFAESRIVTIAIGDADLFAVTEPPTPNNLPAGLTAVAIIEFGGTGGKLASALFRIGRGIMVTLPGSFFRVIVRVLNTSGAAITRNYGALIARESFAPDQNGFWHTGAALAAAPATSALVGIPPFARGYRAYSGGQPCQIEFYDGAAVPVIQGPPIAFNGDSGWHAIPDMATQVFIRNGGIATTFSAYWR